MQPFALILSPLILSTVLLSVNNAAADSGEHKHDHGSHDHSSHSHHEALEPKPPGEPVNAEQATQIAKQRIASLVKAKAINSNWTSVEPDLAGGFVYLSAMPFSGGADGDFNQYGEPDNYARTYLKLTEEEFNVRSGQFQIIKIPFDLNDSANSKTPRITGTKI